MDDDKEFSSTIKERFAQLPKVVQDAITSADIEKHLRDLANTHKLHVDQWEALENQVMLTLLGLESSDDLEKNIKNEVVLPDDIAKLLVEDISKNVFEPVRIQLEQQLNTPSGNARVASAGEINIAERPAIPPAQAPVSPAVPVVPATPPAPAPTTQAVRAPISEAYKAGEPSTARKAVEDDPYRESPQ